MDIIIVKQQLKTATQEADEISDILSCCWRKSICSLSWIVLFMFAIEVVFSLLLEEVHQNILSVVSQLKKREENNKRNLKV